MANYNIDVYADSEFNLVIVINGGTSGSRLELLQGDSITVDHIAVGANTTITVSSFSSTIWTSTANMSLSQGSSATRTVKTSPSLGAFNLTVSAPGYSSGTIYLETTNAVDTNPDAFSFNGVTNAQRSQEYFLGSFLVTGINSSATVVASGTANTKTALNAEDTPTTSNKTVNQNDRVYVYGTTSSAYNTSTTATVSIGTTSYSSTLTTQVDPASGVRVGIGISSPNPISLDNLRKLAGPIDINGIYGAAAFNDYYRGGSRIPNITTGSPNNANVPTSGNSISLSQMYNCMTTLYFATFPSTKSAGANTIGGSGTATVSWSRSDWSLGYPPDMENLCDYQFKHEWVYILPNEFGSFSITMNANGTTYDVKNNDPVTSSYGTGGTVSVTMTATTQAEALYNGKITIYARHKNYPSAIASTEIQYWLSLFGP